MLYYIMLYYIMLYYTMYIYILYDVYIIYPFICLSICLSIQYHYWMLLHSRRVDGLLGMIWRDFITKWEYHGNGTLWLCQIAIEHGHRNSEFSH